MNRFLFIPYPMPLESPTSLLIRAAKKNGFLSVRHMSINVLETGATRWLNLRLQSGPLFRLLCTETPDLAEDFRKIFFDQPRQSFSRSTAILVDGNEVPKNSLATIFRPCPQCIKEGYTRSPQDLIFFESCPYHNTPYLTQCPICSARNHWYEINGFTCRCGFNFKDSVDNTITKPLFFPLTSSFGQNNVTKCFNKHFDDHILRCSFSNCTDHPTLALPAIQSIENLIKEELNTYCKLPLSAFEAPWRRLREEKLRSEILKYVHQFKRNVVECQTANCCSTVRLNFTELRYACHTGRARVRQMIQDGIVETNTTPSSSQIYYSSPNLCAIIQGELAKKTESNLAKIGEAIYLNATQTAEILRTTKTSVLKLFNMGFFEGSLISYRTYFIPKSSVEDIHSNYITANEIAREYSVSSKTITNFLKKLDIYPILESLTHWIPSLYFRSEIYELLTHHPIPTPRTYSYGRPVDEDWLSKKSESLSLDFRTLKDLIRNRFKWRPPYYRLSANQISLIDTWRSCHHSYTEVIGELGITYEIIGSRFQFTNYINTETWGLTKYIHSDDVARMKDHLFRYYSVKQAADALTVTSKTIYLLIEKRVLKTGTPLFTRSGQKLIMILKNQKALSPCSLALISPNTPPNSVK